ncbi:HD domain-containing protein [Agrobacterium rubi]|nr:HD domain-containing protein [Agrobacterium rubi]NTF25113.1 HD domain-containing protein [Agrobacterium rubi]
MDHLKSPIDRVAAAVEAHLADEGSGHDWPHIRRVRKVAEQLAHEEGADVQVAVLAALLHDVDDRKLTGDLQTEIDLPMARRMMADAGVGMNLAETVCDTIGMIGFHKSLKNARERSLEARIVSDADQLDAIGNVGIARTFVYGASKKRPMFEPDNMPMTEFTAEQYDTNRGSTVNHFFEKLLKLRGLMGTASGRKEAEIRHGRMVTFLRDFFIETDAPQEWMEMLEPFGRPQDGAATATAAWSRDLNVA